MVVQQFLIKLTLQEGNMGFVMFRWILAMFEAQVRWEDGHVDPCRVVLVFECEWHMRDNDGTWHQALTKGQ